MFYTGLMSEPAGDGGWIYSLVRSKSLYTWRRKSRRISQGGHLVTKTKLNPFDMHKQLIKPWFTCISSL